MNVIPLTSTVIWKRPQLARVIQMIMNFVMKKMIWTRIGELLLLKLNELIRRGKIGKDRICYKYLQDVVEIFYDPRHRYDDEVVEFFNTLSYLGGRRVVNMILGPMFLGQGRGSVHSLSEAKMNLGGPSETVCLRDKLAIQPGLESKSHLAWRTINLVLCPFRNRHQIDSFLLKILLFIQPCWLTTGLH